MSRAQHGMTLIELMIVVAIVGILATLAVFMFTKSTAKARASEVPAVFAEFRIKQEQYHLENGAYFSTTARFPATPASPKSGGNSSTPSDMPAEWTDDLRIVLDKSVLYCSYETLGGAAGGTYSAAAQALGAPATAVPINFFWSIAECDLDGDTGVNSEYLSISTADGVRTINEGR